jgi:hypothetical protein
MGASAGTEQPIVWEDEIAAIQSTRERIILWTLPPLLGISSVVGVVAVLTIHHRRTFDADSFVCFLCAIFLALAMYLGLWFAYRSKSFLRDHPNERFIPSTVGGSFCLIFLLILNGYLVEDPRPILSGKELILLGLVILNSFLGVVWVAMVIRRSVLDGAWRSKK